MRMAIVVVGVVLLVIGAVLMFVPVVNQGSDTVNTNSTLPGEVVSVSGFSLTGSIPVSIAWTSDAPVVVAAATCSGTCQSNISSVSGVTTQTGTSGTINLNQPDGGEVGFFVLSTTGHAANATFTIKTALTTVGSILLIVGILLLIVGIVLKAKPKGGAAPMPPATDPMGGGSPPPSS